jgi:hypothetical protein
MRRIANGSVTAYGAMLLFAGLAAAAPGPDTRCQAAKNRESGKYAYCLHKTEAKLLKTKGTCSLATTTECYRDDECPGTETCQKDTANYHEAVTRCGNIYAAKWSALETKTSDAMATCPDGLAQADVQQAIDKCVADVAAGLAGGNLEDCGGDLATCNDNHATCATNLGACDASLSTCNTNYATCAGSLTTCNNTLTTCDNTLTTCQSDLNACQNPQCGNNQADLGEQCDGTDLDGATCTSLGFTGGTLVCTGCAYYTGGCTLAVGTCGNGSIEAGESCDQGDLNGATCVSQGFAGGTLRCVSGCAYDTSGCYVTRFVDNGDGTISDYETGLTWEKKSDDGSIHDKNNEYSWSTGSGNPDGTVYTTYLAALNAGGGFAGHTDWRLPTREELESIIDYAHPVVPAVQPAFHTSCVPSCTVTTCSCTWADRYWTSNTVVIFSSSAWAVNFSGGSVAPNGKTNFDWARAVRTGL